MVKSLLLSVLVASTVAGQSSQAPSNFAVRIEFGCNGVDVVDTAKGTYEREMSRGPRQVAGIAINGELKERWFRLANDARFFDISSKRLEGVAHCEPSSHVAITMVAYARRHTVRFESCADADLPEEFRPANAEYRRIKTLVSEILKEVEALPSVTRLRPSGLFCL